MPILSSADQGHVLQADQMYTDLEEKKAELEATLLEERAV